MGEWTFISGEMDSGEFISKVGDMDVTRKFVIEILHYNKSFKAPEYNYRFTESRLGCISMT